MPKPRALWLALGLPVGGLFLVGWIGRVSGAVLVHTLLGMTGAAVGGVAAGITAKRFLANGKNTLETLWGLGVTTAIGLVTIGYMYLFYIQKDMQTILALPRNVEQTFIFVEFLTAQYAGILWAGRWFPPNAAPG